MIITPMYELMRIEPATIEDFSLLAELLMELFGQEPDFRPDYNNQMRDLRLILEQPAFEIEIRRVFVPATHCDTEVYITAGESPALFNRERTRSTK